MDAGPPENGKSRVDQFESTEAADEFRQSAQGGQQPAWTYSDLREVIPENAVRERFVGELKPLPLQVYEESLPVFPGWPDAPVGYLRFGNNSSYEAASQKAKQEGFAFSQEEGQHFHHAARCYANVSTNEVMHRNYRSAEWDLDQGIAYTADRDMDTYNVYLRGWLARMRFEQGLWAGAENIAEEVLHFLNLPDRHQFQPQIANAAENPVQGGLVG